MECTLKHDEQAFKNMVAVAGLLTALSPNNAQYLVRDVYLDFGQDWMWTTIIRRGYHDCQVLSPREWENIVLADGLTDIAACVEDIRNGDWFADR